MSSVLLAENLSRKDAGAGSDMPPGDRPKFLQGIRYYKRGRLLTCFFMRYNTAAESNATTLQFDVLRDEQSVLQVPARPVASYVFGKNKKGLELQDQIKLDVPPGLYEFRVSVRDRRPNQPIQQSVVFGVED